MIDNALTVVSLLAAAIGVSSGVLLLIIRWRQINDRPSFGYTWVGYSDPRKKGCWLRVSFANHSSSAILIHNIELIEKETQQYVCAKLIEKYRANGDPLLSDKFQATVQPGTEEEFCFEADISKFSLFSSEASEWVESEGLSNREVVSRLRSMNEAKLRIRTLRVCIGNRVSSKRLELIDSFPYGDSLDHLINEYGED